MALLYRLIRVMSISIPASAQLPGLCKRHIELSVDRPDPPVDCIATLEELSACTVHEINQPVAALMTNAQAALRFLAGQNPNLDEVRHALTRVLRLGNRIIAIVDRTRALLHRAPPRKDDFEINEAIREIISLSQEELVKNAVSVHTRFAPGLPLFRADRVQLQQVVLNLITNAVEAMSGVPEGTREL